MRGVLIAAAVLVIAGFAVAPAQAQVHAALDVKTDGPLCSAPYLVEHAEWSFCWQLDEARVQGLEINDARYQDTRVFWKAGVPFSITRYHLNSYGPYKDAFGNAGAGGHTGYGRGAIPLDSTQCPRYEATGTLLGNNKVCLETSGGPVPQVTIWSLFDVYNYRFANGWTLKADGEIDPFVKLGGNLIDRGSCWQTGGQACLTHFHHVYWRFDLDIAGAGGDSVQEYHRTETTGAATTRLTEDACFTHPRGGPWCTMATESVRVRDYATFTKWRAADFDATNSNGHARSYELLATGQGAGDHVSPSDFMAVVYRSDSTEIGYEVPTNPHTDAPVMRYAATQEPLNGEDVVLWYIEHVIHEPRDEELPTMMWHTTGPKLLPRNFLTANNIEQTM